MNNFLKCLQIFQEKTSDYQGNILIETLDYDFYDWSQKGRTAYEYFCEAENIAAIIEKTGSGLVIDLCHVLVTVGNLLGNNNFSSLDIVQEAKKYIATCCQGNYGLIKEIHFFPPRYDQVRGIMHHYDAPIFGTNLIAADLSGTPEYRWSIELLKHIISEHNKVSREKLIINFETAIKNMAKDIAAFNREYQV